MKAIMEKKAVNKTVICLMVENQPNVLARISSLVGRRSFNISTITASETNVSGITRLRWWSMGMMKMCCIRLSPR